MVTLANQTKDQTLHSMGLNLINFSIYCFVKLMHNTKRRVNKQTNQLDVKTIGVG
jgi:hypothetical protein